MCFSKDFENTPHKNRHNYTIAFLDRVNCAVYNCDYAEQFIKNGSVKCTNKPILDKRHYIASMFEKAGPIPINLNTTGNFFIV